MSNLFAPTRSHALRKWYPYFRTRRANRAQITQGPWEQADRTTNQPDFTALQSQVRNKASRNRVWTPFLRRRHLATAQPPAIILQVRPLVVQHTTVPGGGIVVQYQNASYFGDTFVNVGGAELDINNEGGTPVTVTVTAVNPCNQFFYHPLVLSIPAGQEGTVGPFDYHYTNSSTGIVTVNYDTVAGVSVAVVAP